MNLIDQLNIKHELYGEVQERAEYLYRSYTGGDIYRNGYYLTRYYGEDSAGHNIYQKRLNATPLNNYVRTTVDIYRSFLFREYPTRNVGALLNNPLFTKWLDDTDNDGQSIDSFMKTVNDKAMVEGGVWILVDKPAYATETVAQEIALGIRAYAATYSISNVLDWEYTRSINGKMSLTYIKVIESNTKHSATYSIWTPEMITKFVVSKDDHGELKEVVDSQEFVNPLGYVPFVFYTAQRSIAPGVGESLVEDVADVQKYIYNLNSELEQTIRISSHPSLAKTATTEANAGAGSVITMPEDLDPGLRPYLLQPTGATIDGILDAMEKQIEAIQRMTHTSAVQASKGSPVSGVALQTERALLNAKLSDIADNLQECEYKLHAIWADWHALELADDFTIEYATTFDMRDSHSDVELFRKALELNDDPAFADYIKGEVVDLLVGDPQQAERLKG